MKRLTIKPRLNWQQKCDEVGFHFYYMNGLYWNEGACYQFSAEEIDELEAATAELQRLCLEAVERVITENRFNQLCIPPEFAALCRHSWQRHDPSIYGRFDFIYDGIHPPKLLEYNADTPTALLEASVVQWTWLEDVFPEQDQFNSIHEKLLIIFDQFNCNHQTLYFSCEQNSLEDLGTVEYLRDVAIQAGLKTKHLFIDDIGWSQDEHFFCDLENEKIEHLFKLYPWEWMILGNIYCRNLCN